MIIGWLSSGLERKKERKKESTRRAKLLKLKLIGSTFCCIRPDWSRQPENALTNRAESDHGEQLKRFKHGEQSKNETINQ